MSGRIAELISGAMVECEKEMHRSMEGRAEGAPLPRKWFAYNALQRKLTPIYHAAEQESRRR